MALMQINVVPLGTSTPSVGEHVAAIQDFLEQEGVTCRLHDMGTIIEGKAADLFSLAAKIHEVPFRNGLCRVVTQIVVDDRRDKEVALGDKVESVHRRCICPPSGQTA